MIKIITPENFISSAFEDYFGEPMDLDIVEIETGFSNGFPCIHFLAEIKERRGCIDTWSYRSQNERHIDYERLVAIKYPNQQK